MPDTMAQFTAKLGLLHEQLNGASLRQITTKVAAKSKETAVGAIDPNHLSHWGRGRKGYTVKARYELKSDGQAVVQPTIAPLIALLEDGSGDRWSAPKRRGSARRKKGTAGKRSGYDRRPVPPRHAWTKAVEKIEPPIPGLIHDEVQRVLREVWG
jgi:hypothetical protein